MRLRGCNTPFLRRTLGNCRLCRFWRPPRFLNSPEQQCYPNITIDDYSRRIDKFVYDLKGLFRDLGHAVVKYEYELRERGRKRQTKKKKRTVLKKNFYDKSTTEEWTQADAAKLLGISTRQLRRYKTNPPKDWPGWENPLTLKKWKINHDDRDAMAFALKKSLSYKEGITEKHIKKFS